MFCGRAGFLYSSVVDGRLNLKVRCGVAAEYEERFVAPPMVRRSGQSILLPRDPGDFLPASEETRQSDGTIASMHVPDD